MDFEQFKMSAADDLREMAKHLNEAADQIQEGDMSVMDDWLNEKFHTCWQILVLRHDHRQEQKDGG